MDSINLYTDDFELILVVEGTEVIKDIEALIANEWIDKSIIIIQNKEPKGYAGALNTGLELATGKYICFMNNDTVAVPGWMSSMLKGFKDNVGMVVPTFWGSGGRQSIEWNDGTEFDYVDNVFSIIGVCFLIKREVLDKIGNWDESFGHGGEDFDITKRIMDAGYDIVVARKSFIYHYGGASTRELLNNDVTKAHQNQINKLELFSKKHNISMEDIMEKINTSSRF